MLECGPDVSKLKPGDLVIPARAALGTWRSTAVYNESDVVRLNPRLDVTQAAVLKINPSTAYLMLKSAPLKPGDCVIQDGATSAVAIYVMQMCKIMGIHTSMYSIFLLIFIYFVVNLFRPRETVEKTEATRKALEDFGGTLVLTEEELKQRKDLQDLGPIKLGLDCLAGEPASTLIENLSRGGILINYGDMTRQPIRTPVNALLFNDVQVRGYGSLFIRDPSYRMDMTMLNELHTEWKTAISRSLFKDDIPTNLPRKHVLSFPEAS